MSESEQNKWCHISYIYDIHTSLCLLRFLFFSPLNSTLHLDYAGLSEKF